MNDGVIAKDKSKVEAPAAEKACPERSRRVLMKGNEAIVRGAIDGGCRYFFGYPITPQNEIPELMSELMPQVGGVFLQAESELAAINMVYGAASAGVRVMTSSSSPGVSLMQEGISYIAGSELPVVIVNVVRGGPGLGNIAAAQSDYFQSVKGGGHGDYRTLVLAPWSVQEMYDHTRQAFDLADEYRTPIVVLADAILGQMMEPLMLSQQPPPQPPAKPWATTGAQGRPKNIINSLYIVPEDLEEVNLRIQARYQEAARRETTWEIYNIDNAEIVLVAYGTSARVCRTALDLAREQGLRVGMLRPITLFPFPSQPLAELAEKAKAFLVVEMSLGQMVEDVKLAVEGRAPVHFHGRTAGIIPTSKEVVAKVQEIAKQPSMVSKAEP